jgi:hypothetical protein
MDLKKSVAANRDVYPACGRDVCPGGSNWNMEVYQFVVPEETERP